MCEAPATDVRDGRRRYDSHVRNNHAQLPEHILQIPKQITAGLGIKVPSIANVSLWGIVIERCQLTQNHDSPPCGRPRHNSVVSSSLNTQKET
ncbi:hypothetical protein E2C01_082723 [Portunus trituberculatus]|uniref:Uncharacterized protein n=1 Tax=Portunus trituberculatus TaxID=210409 RepID=A0A5B7J020_PORTR|nr:hypothetical protein [Portunus trituberculatus]